METEGNDRPDMAADPVRHPRSPRNLAILARKLVSSPIARAFGELFMLGSWGFLISYFIVTPPVHIPRSLMLALCMAGSGSYLLGYIYRRTIRLQKCTIQAMARINDILEQRKPLPPDGFILSEENWDFAVNLILDMATFVNERALDGFVAWLDQQIAAKYQTNFPLHPERALVAAHITDLLEKIRQSVEDTGS